MSTINRCCCRLTCEWLPDDHLACFVIDAIEELDLEPLYAAYRADGATAPRRTSRR